MLDVLKGMELDRDGSCVEMGLTITTQMIEDMAESFTESFEDFGFGYEDSYEFEEVGDSSREDELANVELAVAAMMADPDIPVRSLETDERILDFAGTETDATNDMTNGGLVTIAEGSDVNPPSEYLAWEWTEYAYWVQADGRVHQVGIWMTAPKPVE